MAQSASAKPVRKVAAGGSGAALTVLIVWVIGEIGWEVPPEIASAFTTLIAFWVSYFVPPGEGEVIAG